jgi:predicted nucleic acid-binding protein
MAWCFADEATAETWAILERFQSEKAIVPALWPLEVANVLLMAERRQRIKAAQAGAFIEQLSLLPIDIDDQTAPRALHEIYALAKTATLTAYDASYLELAIRRHCALATTDQALVAAADEAGIAILPAM